VGGGKWVKSLADSMNRARIRMQTVSSVWVAQGKRRGEINSLKSEGTFWLDVLLLDRMQPVPERESARDD
jgi:hypothetical protein